jgi:hypothetical protein
MTDEQGPDEYTGPGYEPQDGAPPVPQTLPADDEEEGDGGDYDKALDRHDLQ